MSNLQPPWAGLAPLQPYDVGDSYDLRTGPKLHPWLLGLLPLVGIWRGRGKSVGDSSEGCDIGQEIRFSHDGQPFLRYESWAWVVDDHGAVVRPLFREMGWWRPIVVEGKVTDEVEALITHPTGVQELYLGVVKGTARFELATDTVVRTSTAPHVTAGHRLYGIVDRALLYAHDRAREGCSLCPYTSARLERVAG